MASFHGSVRLEADPASAVRALVEVGPEEIVLYAGDAEIGRWARDAVSVSQTGTSFLLDADEERLLLEMEEAAAFGAAVGASETETAATAPGEDDGPPGGFDRLRKASAETYDEDAVLDRAVGLALAVAGAVLVLGAVLSWGPARIISDGFPLARVLAGLSGIAALVGAYLGMFGEQRVNGGWLAIGASIVALVVLYLSAREAGIRIGYLIALVGALAVLAVGVASIRPSAAAPSGRTETEPHGDD